MFLANYTDGLSDLPLPDQLNHFQKHGKVASFACVRPNLSYHHVSCNPDSDLVSGIQDMSQSDTRMNGGYFIFRKEIFKYLRDGEELVREPFQRLIQEQQLLAYRYGGFWASMDTFKDKQHLDDLYAKGNAPWQVWKNGY
jgi:glucose-1-phosphate cytidylyltransferase